MATNSPPHLGQNYESDLLRLYQQSYRDFMRGERREREEGGEGQLRERARKKTKFQDWPPQQPPKQPKQQPKQPSKPTPNQHSPQHLTLAHIQAQPTTCNSTELARRVFFLIKSGLSFRGQPEAANGFYRCEAGSANTKESLREWVSVSVPPEMRTNTAHIQWFESKKTTCFVYHVF